VIHRYVSKHRISGIWLTSDAPPNVYCGWWWDREAHTLHVKMGEITRRWSPPTRNPTVLQRLMQELPEVARGIACQLRREAERQS
jgi:hypothetical protein